MKMIEASRRSFKQAAVFSAVTLLVACLMSYQLAMQKDFRTFLAGIILVAFFAGCSVLSVVLGVIAVRSADNEGPIPIERRLLKVKER